MVTKKPWQHSRMTLSRIHFYVGQSSNLNSDPQKKSLKYTRFVGNDKVMMILQMEQLLL